MDRPHALLTLSLPRPAVHLTAFLVVTLISGRIIASRDGVDYLDGFFLSVSAITAGGLVPLDMSRLSSGSHGLLFTLFTFAGVTFTALPPLLWRVWLFRARFRPLIAEAQALTAAAAAARAEEAQLAARLAAALAASEAAAAKRTAAAAARAVAAWTVPSAAAAAAQAHAETAENAELTFAPGDMLELSTPSPPSTPPLQRGASFQEEAAAANVSLPLHRTMSFSAAFFGGGGLFGGQQDSQSLDVAQRAAAAESAAAEASRAAAAAAAFSQEDADDYAALSADFEAQNEGLVSVAAAVAVFVVSWHVFGAIAFARCYAAEGPHLPVLVARGITPAWLSIFLLSSALVRSCYGYRGTLVLVLTSAISILQSARITQASRCSMTASSLSRCAPIRSWCSPQPSWWATPAGPSLCD